MLLFVLMRAVIQRVSRASVVVKGSSVGAIQCGVLIFLGVGKADSAEDIKWLVGRIIKLRIFEDETGKMNRSLLEIEGEALVVSQFTLFGSLKKGNRPSFNRAALPELAVPLYEQFVEELSAALGRPVPTGCFGQHMAIEAHNDGPVTLVVDTQARDF
jgi:D-tyrosyl-tRNA(Tyr) deacylase